MNTFVNTINPIDLDNQVTYDTSIQLTDNGAVSYASSLNHNVDLFFRIGSARGQNLNDAFDKAFAEDPNMAIRMLQWVRDVRGGAGERQTFRSILKHMESQPKYHYYLSRIIPNIAEIGRWDDFFVFQTKKYKEMAYRQIEIALAKGNALAAKWCPRERSNRKEDRQIARELMAFLKLSPKAYRKLLVDGTKVVETQMCAKEWDQINFQAVPSVASRRYAKAFGKNATVAYSDYLVKVAEGGAKMNASAIFPYDVASIATQWNADATSVLAADLQWKALPDYTNGKRILAMIDLSSSMNDLVPGTRHSHRHMAISLGLYVAEKNKGAFKNVFLAFSEDPVIGHVKDGNIVARYQSIANSVVAYSTNFQKAFDYILIHAIKHKVSNDEMPEIIVVPSDMQFSATGSTTTNFQSIRNKFENAGYSMPKLVFWQMNGSKTDTPTRSNQDNVSLISGFSPAILKSVLGDVEIEKAPVEAPIDIMKKALFIPRYDF